MVDTVTRPDLTSGLALGIDVGGTFTDVVLAGPSGQLAVAKVLSTHDDPAAGITAGVQAALAGAGRKAAEVERVVHATTLATNAILERQGARVAHLTTQGFRAMIPLGRYARVEEDRFDLYFDPPPPPVPAEDCFDVPERMDRAGAVMVPLDELAVRDVAAEIRRRGIDAVSVAFLHSYANPAHERRAVDVLRAELGPDATIVCSSEIWPEIREYERSTTTIMSAYIGPLMTRYLASLQQRLRAIGIDCTVQVMESGGGVMSAELASRRAVATVESGPAAGVLAARLNGLELGYRDVISFDMGGTTAKACVIRDGVPDITHEFHVGGKGSFGGRRSGTGVPIKTPAIDLAEVGAGGGSIAWIDPAGALRVGPRSAGSEPGPACYSRGGTDPTVTDANLVLGYLDPGVFAGGTMRLDSGAADHAIEKALAGPLGTSPSAAAYAVHQIANAAMGSAVHVVTVQRGIDPRRFALVAFGGAGPMHAAKVAEGFGIRTVIVPPSCGVGSAVGLLATDLVTDRALTRLIRADDVHQEELDRIFAGLAADGARDLAVQLDDYDVRVERSLDLRFQGQAHELTMDLGAHPLDRSGLDAVRDAFHERYAQAYGITVTGPIEIVTFRARIVHGVERVPLGRRSNNLTGGSAPTGTRPVCFDASGDYVETGVYARDQLAPGTEVTGPAIIGDLESTIVVPPGWRATVDAGFHMVLSQGTDSDDRGGADD